MTQIERAFVLLFSDSMSDLAVNLASAKLNAALGRLSTIQTITTEEVDEAIEQIITEMAWEKTMEALQGGAARLLQAQIIKGGGISANIPKSIATRFAFDAVDDRAVLWAEAQAGALIREIDDETRTAIKKIVVDSLKGGYSGDDAAEMVSRIIGLNTRQTLAVENLYQNTVKSLTEDGVSARQARSRAKKMAAEYRERLIEYRGKMIARTEIMRAANNGRLLSWAQALDDGLIASTMLKEWRTYPGFGARGPCPICLELRGTTVEIFSEFPNGSMMPPAHPFCRCTSVLVPPTRGTTRTAQVGGGYVGPIDPIGAVLSQEVDSTVEKANPYHDPKTGRFTHAPTGSRKVEIKPVEENYSLTGTPNYETGEAKGTITIERVEGTGGEAADDWISAYTGSSKGRNRDAVENDITVDSEVERNWYTSSQEEQAASAKLMGLDVPPLAAYSALSNRPAANQLHSAIHAAKRPQPSVFRGVREPFVGSINGESQTPRVGDSLVLPLTSFSRDRKVAFGFTKEIVGVYRPQAIQNAPKLRDGSTMVRIRPGGRGYSLSRAGLQHGKVVMLDELEVISAGRFRVTGTAVIRVTHPDLPGPREMTVIDLEHTDVWNPDTGALEPLTIAKAKFRDFGGSLAHLFIGRQIPESAEDFQKANPYHDPRTGRFTFAPANDMGGGAAGLSASEEALRADFRKRMADAKAKMPEADQMYKPIIHDTPQPGMHYVMTEDGKLQVRESVDNVKQMHDAISIGKMARTEIDRRTELSVRSEKPELESAYRVAVGKRDRLRDDPDFATAKRVRETAIERSRTAQEGYEEAVRATPAYKSLREQHAAAKREALIVREEFGRRSADGSLRLGTPEREAAYMELGRADRRVSELEQVMRYTEVGPSFQTGYHAEPVAKLRAKYPEFDAIQESPEMRRLAIEVRTTRAGLKEANDVIAGWETKISEASTEVHAAEMAIWGLRSSQRRKHTVDVLRESGVKLGESRKAIGFDYPQDGTDIVLRTRAKKRGKGQASLERNTQYVPAKWIESSNAYGVETSAGRHDFGTVEVSWKTGARGYHMGDRGTIVTDKDSTTLHEIMHRVERTRPSVLRSEGVFYTYRTGSEATKPMQELRPGYRYGSHEVSKPDKFFEPYAGKSYGGRAYELLSVGYTHWMYDADIHMDEEYAGWVLSTLILT